PPDMSSTTNYPLSLPDALPICLGERPNEIAAVLDAADRGHVRLLLDVAHYQQGGGDPVGAIKHYAPWIQVMHLKDVVSRNGTSGDRKSTRLNSSHLGSSYAVFC